MKRFFGNLLSVIFMGIGFLGIILFCGCIKPYIPNDMVMDGIVCIIVILGVIIICAGIGVISYFTNDELHPVEPQYNNFYRR